RPERAPAARHQRRGVGALARPPGALLAERLLAATRHRAAILHRRGALALVAEVALDREPDQVLVHLLREQRVRQGGGALLGAIGSVEFGVHISRPASG